MLTLEEWESETETYLILMLDDHDLFVVSVEQAELN